MIREHFLNRIFITAAFRDMKESGSINELIRFHTENKLLLMAYDKQELKLMGDMVANRQREPFSEIVSGYERHLLDAISRPANHKSIINVLLHCLGYFSNELTHPEKRLLLDHIQMYREDKVSLLTCKVILRSWILRFENEYLMNQTFFDPYPPGLMGVDPIFSERGSDMS